jgi:predicted dehydrogenase
VSTTRRVALLGTGFMGEFHARAYNTVRRTRPDHAASIDLVADVTEELAAAFARRWGVERWTTDWAAAVSDPSVDIVDICAPPVVHRELALAALAHGKHVYCEKPVGRTVAETREIAATARAAGVHTLVGFNYRWFPAVAFAKQLIDEGFTGQIRHVRMEFDSDWAADPAVPWAWRLSRDQAGHGVLGDVGSHMFDMARLLAGEITSVCGQLTTFIGERHDGEGMRAVDNDDAFDAIVRFANGAAGEFSGSRVATGSKVEFRVEIAGERGSIRWNVNRLNELQLYDGRNAGRDAGFRTVLMGPQHPYQGEFSPVQGLGAGFEDSKAIELAAFVDGLAAGEPVAPTFDDAETVAEIIEAVAKGEWTSPGGRE